MDAELAAEKRPRRQDKWLEGARQKSRLPTIAGAPTRGEARDHGDGAPPGKRKQRRLAELAKKKSKAAQKEMAATQRATDKAAKALKGKIKMKDGDVCDAAAKILAACPKNAEDEQRLLARIAEHISANPQQDLEQADVFFQLHRHGSDRRTRQLALLSAVAVFKDLVPAYRIRDLTKQEKSTQLSKDVLELNKHEIQLLLTYKRLLPLLEAAMKKEPLVFAPALAALVKAAFDFNYRVRLLGTAVHHACHPLPAVRGVLAQGLQEMFEADMRLMASRDCILAVGRLAQATAFKAAKKPGLDGEPIGKKRPLAVELLKALLHLPVGRAEAAELRGDAGGLDGADDDIREAFAESSTSHGVMLLRKAEAELLYEVFCVYLRILRQRHLHSRALLAAVLTGLARWGQHVNLELLLEILTELRHTVQDALGRADELVSLQGLNCALVLLGGPSQALIADATWLADAMSNALTLALPSLYSVHSESAQWPPAGSFSVHARRMVVSQARLSLSLETESIPALLLRCLEAALNCPQCYGKASDAALAMLIEHLFLLAASADIHVGLPLLREAAFLLRKHHRLHTLLDIDGGLFGLGQVADRSVSVVWPLQPLAFSLSRRLATSSVALRAAIVQRRTLLADVFPFKDVATWMQAEFAHHLAALSAAPEPRKTKRRRSGTTNFMSESELGRVWGSSSA